jgi:hypothetical protein
MTLKEALKDTDEVYDAKARRMEDSRRDLGELFIDFAREQTKKDNSQNPNYKIEALFVGPIAKIFNHGRTHPERFNGTGDLAASMRESLGKNYGFYSNRSDRSIPREVKNNIFDDDQLDYLIQSVHLYATHLPDKAKSLTYSKNVAAPGETGASWDMRIIFRKNYTDNKIEMKMSANTDVYGVPMGFEEKEVYDTLLFPKPKKKLFGRGV